MQTPVMDDGLKSRDATPSHWTVLSLIEWSTQYLTERRFDEARLHVELLLARVLKLNRLNLYLQFDRPLTSEELASFKQMFKRRLAHEPLQYILGDTSFMGLSLKIDRRALVPRPETEILVEQALQLLRASDAAEPRVLDIGSGSGNISLAIAHHVPRCRVDSLDVSDEAIDLSRENQTALGIHNVVFLRADIFGDLPPAGTYDLIVSNPPYVSLEEFTLLEPEVRDYEPRLAVTDEADGLRFLKQIGRTAMKVIAPGGTLMVEIAYNQEEAARRIFAESGWRIDDVTKDFAGHPRIVIARPAIPEPESVT
jgi:release factor glutamine methyltransferase